VAHSRKPGSLGTTAPLGVLPARTPGPLGKNDHPDPNSLAVVGDSPGPLGRNDHVSPPRLLPAFPVRDSAGRFIASAAPHQAASEPPSGSIPLGVGSPGIVSVVRIPIPGTNGLFLELSPRGFVPKTGSTSSLFIQDSAGKRVLRLDYGFNKSKGSVDYHWNQKGTFNEFGIADHTSVGAAGEALYKSAKYLKYGGRVLLIVGVASDLYAIVVAKKRLRQVARVAAGWGGAWGGGEALGALGAELGTAIEPGLGTAIGGFVLGSIGAAGGYFGASWAAGEAYDYVEETYFEQVPTSDAP
jgi:hypothetical protein